MPILSTYNAINVWVHASRLLICCFVLFVSCKKEEEKIVTDTWVQLKDFPGIARSDGISFSVQGKGYYGMGGNNTTPFMRDIWSYDPKTDSWQQKGDFPFDLPAITSLGLNDKGYVMTYSGSLYEYDASLDKWKYLKSFPSGNRPGLTGFALNGFAYFGTGNNINLNNFTVYKDFWKYDIINSIWSQVNDLPGLERTEALSFIIADKAYVGLGYNGKGAPPYYTNMWSYNAVGNQWNAIADFPSSSIAGVVFSTSTKGYIGVDSGNSNPSCNVYEYDPSSNAWKMLRPFPSASFLYTNSIIISDRVFIVGGWRTNYSNQVWEYKP